MAVFIKFTVTGSIRRCHIHVNIYVCMQTCPLVQWGMRHARAMSALHAGSVDPTQHDPRRCLLRRYDACPPAQRCHGRAKAGTRSASGKTNYISGGDWPPGQLGQRGGPVKLRLSLHQVIPVLRASATEPCPHFPFQMSMAPAGRLASWAEGS